MNFLQFHTKLVKAFLTWTVVALLALAISACQTVNREPTEAELRAEYVRVSEAWTSKFRGESEYNVRHIMVNSKEQADAALARIRAGESFGAVANAVSLDEGSNRKGGELGWNLGAGFTPEFTVAMKALGPAGIVESPVRTQFGWHIIEVTGMRPPTMPPFDELRAQLVLRLQAAKARR